MNQPPHDRTPRFGRLQDWQQRRHLGADDRAGAHSKRQIRSLQREWLRRAWPVLVALAAATAAVAAFMHLLLPQRLEAYGVGAVVASSVWVAYFVMLDTSGIANLRVGVEGEQQTAREARRLRRTGWRLVNHVMLEHTDIDHVLIGPGGCFALETKYRTSWQQVPDRELQTWANHSRAAARAVYFRTGRITTVVPIIVAWGPRVREVFAQPMATYGVTICSGHDLVDVVSDHNHELSPADIDVMYDQLVDYVDRRSAREIADAGPVPRPLTDHMFDLAFGLLAGMLAALAIGHAARVSPVPVTYFATCAVLIAAGWLALRRFTSRRIRAIALGAGTASVVMLLIGIVIVAVNVADSPT